MSDEPENRSPPSSPADDGANDAIAGFTDDGGDDKKKKDDKKSDAKSEAEKTAKEREDEKKKKELDEAKKESKNKSSKYSAVQANVMVAQGRSVLMAMPFIIVGIVVVLVVVKNGGKWIQGATQFVIDSAIGKK
ncbi:MAG: hypothetical protein LBI29_04550 [Rickettsiales bacterium]|jgi:uncharacterized membrane protein YdbT with pleckstrin-like domain|nr:hypothetical protein [Rickettsiales bacterium]